MESEVNSFIKLTSVPANTKTVCIVIIAQLFILEFSFGSVKHSWINLSDGVPIKPTSTATLR